MRSDRNYEQNDDRRTNSWTETNDRKIQARLTDNQTLVSNLDENKQNIRYKGRNRK